MIISEVSKLNNDVVAFCTGTDLPIDKTITAIKTSSGSELTVKKSDCNISFSGNKTALLSFDGVDDIKQVPLGDFKIISSFDV